MNSSKNSQLAKKTQNNTKSQNIITSIENINPPLVIENIQGFNIVRDDLLHGGTKQRACSIIENIKEKEVVYAGPWNGFAQVALAIGCKLFNKKAILFMTRNDYWINKRAMEYGCKIMVYKNKNLKELQELAKNYVDKKNTQCEGHSYLIPFGFDSDEFKSELYKRLVCASKDICINDRSFYEYSQTVWVVAGSTTLLSILYKLFPNAQFGVVQVGKTVWPDQIEENRTILYIAPETFYENAIFIPPYPSVEKYDAKVWQFVIKNGKDGDLVWNVAG